MQPISVTGSINNPSIRGLCVWCVIMFIDKLRFKGGKPYEKNTYILRLVGSFSLLSSPAYFCLPADCLPSGGQGQGSKLHRLLKCLIKSYE